MRVEKKDDEESEDWTKLREIERELGRDIELMQERQIQKLWLSLQK
jgi:hypothetical protein